MKENLNRFILFLLLVGCAYHQFLTRFLTNRKLRFFLFAGIFLINTQSVSAQCFSNPPDNIGTTVFYTCSGGLSYTFSSKSGISAPKGASEPEYGTCSTAGQRLENAQWLILKASDNGIIQIYSVLETGGISVWIWGGYDNIPSDCSQLTDLTTCGPLDHDDPLPFTVVKDKYYVVLLSGMLGSAPDFTITGTGPANIPPPTVISQSRCGSGTVTLTASGALTGEKYNWYDSDGNLLQSSTNAQFITPELSATTQYTVRTSVTTNTSTSCESDPTTVTVTINNLPSVTVPPVSTSICEGSNFILSATATGSTDLTYQWRKDGVNITGATSASHTINNAISSDAGSYDVVISNSCGSTTSDAAVVTVNAIPTVTVPASFSVCPGASIPATTFTSSPTGATYSWTNSNTAIGLSASDIGNVPAFTATNSTTSSITSTITVTPTLNGCTGIPVSYTITVKPQVTVAVSDITVCSGAIVPSSSFISAPLGATFSWTNSNTNIGLTETSGTGNVHSFTATNPTASPITSTITVIPTINGCVGSPATYTITVNPLPVITTEIATNETICGSSNGTITITATGSAPLEYSIDGGNTFFQNGGVFTGLAAGSYSVAVKNSNACYVMGQTLSIASPSPPPSPIVTPVSNSVCEGSDLTLTITNPEPGATYTWTGPMGYLYSGPEATRTIFNISTSRAGKYGVTTTVSSCVSAASTFDIIVNPLPVATVPSSMVVCSGTEIPATVFTSTPDDADYTWSVDNTAIGLSTASGTGNVPAFTTTNNTTSRIQGIFTVTPILNGCPGTSSSYSIWVDPLPTATISGDATICYGASTNLSVALTGTAPWTITYTDGSTPVTVSGINSNPYIFTVSPASTKTYTITNVSDANSCSNTGSGSAVITVPLAPLSASVSKTNVTCYGSATGSISYTISGGTSPYKITYTYNSGSASGPQTIPASGSLSNLPAGTYQITLTDANNCTPIVQTIVINQPTAALAGTAASTNVTCTGTDDGTITINPSGGYGSYEYSIDDGTSWQSSNTFAGLSPQSYHVKVRDAVQTSCVVSINTSLTITEPTAITGTATPTHITCFGLTDGAITVNASGGYGTYQYSIDGGTTWQSSNTFTGLSPRSYTINIRDALHQACTSVIDNITIIQPAAPVAGTASSTNVTCFNAGDGTITIFATGGYGTYEYSINGGATWQTGNTFTNLGPDSYHVLVRDLSQTACIVTVNPSLTIVQPTAAVTGSAISSNVTCYGINNGTITINASGGYGNYEYTINGGTDWQTGNTFNNLVPGSYNVQVRDANQPSCTYIVNASLAIIQPTAEVSGTATSTNITCFGLTDGTITINASGGYGNFEYSINGGLSWQVANVFTNLAPASYNVRVRDAAATSCVAIINTSLIIAQPTAAVSGTASSTNVTCFGLGNGTISITAAGGYGTYEYSINGGTTWQTGNTFTNLGPDSYHVLVRDLSQTACVATVNPSLTISQPVSAVSGTATSTNITCFGLNNGTISISASGGYGNYEYTINGGTNWQIGNTFNNLAPGNYNVQVRDADQTSCAYIVNESLTIIQPAAPVAGTAVSTNITCQGESDGTITINASGGYGNYEYSIDGGLNWQSNHTFTGLSPGNYAIQLRDVDRNSCAAVVNASITEPAALTLDGSHSPILCYGGSTTVTLVAGGGTGALEYRLGAGSYQASNTFTGVVAGSHQFWVRDINGCEQEYSVTISQPAQLTLTASASPIQCDGTSTVTLLAQGGSGNYQFRNGTDAYQVANTFNLGQGSYTFYVSDGACEESVVVNIAGLSTLTLTASFTPITCFGGSSTVTLTATGGNGSYSYKADNGVWQTGNTFALPSGDHIFTVRDAGGCQQFFQVNIPETEQLNVILTKLKDASCFGTSTGSLSLSMTGNKGTVNITWFKDGQPISTPPDLNTLSAGSYLVQVTDACSSITSNEIIIQPSPLTVLLRKIKDADCTGTATGALDLQISGGEGTVIQTWTKDGAVISTPANLSALAAGTYRVTVQDNCSTVQSENIIIDPAALQIDFYKITDVSCKGSADGGIGMRIFNSTGATTVSWFKDNTPVSTPADLRQLTAGTYHIQVADFCSQVTSAKISITEPETLAAGILSKKDVSCFGGTDGSATLTITGGTAPYRYLWSNNSTNKDLTGVSTGTYTVTVTDLNNCSATQSVTITEPAALTLDGSHSPILCYGGSTTVTLVAGGGTGALEYRLGAGSYQPSNTFTGVVAGSHQFWVRDINGCEQDYSVTISQPAQLTLTATASPIQCDGTSTVTLLAQGGTGNYQFRNGSDPYQASNTFNLGQGSYTFYVTDGACEESVVVNIAGQSSLTLTGSFTPIACFGGNSTVTLTANGGNGSYTYKADNGSWQTGNTFALPSGDHIFAVRDAGGCQQFFQVNIPETEKLNVILTKLKDASCFGASTGSLSLSMTANKGTVNITWFKDGQAISAPPDLNTLSAGSYLVQVTDACSSITSNEIIIQPSPLTVLLRKIKDADCTGTATGALDLQISGGEGTVIQTWTKDGAAISTPANLSALAAGTYRVTVQDNCSTVQSENIIIDPAALQVDFYKITDVSCKGNSDGGIGMRIFNSTGTTTVSWFKDNAPVSTPVDLRQLTAGTYHVQVADYCSQVTSAKISITEPEALAAGTLIVKHTVCKTSNDGEITANITGGTKPYRFQWNGLSQTSSVISNLSPGLYELLVTDAEGCTVTASVEVLAGNCPPIAIDDRFTTDEEVVISGSVAINDFDRQNESLTFSMTSAVKNGRIVFTDDGKFIYTPNPGFWATETFTYQVCNTSGLCAEATAYISVIPYTVVSLTPAILNVREGKKTAITAKLMRPFKDDVIITISYSGNAIKEKDYVLLDQFQQIRIPKGQVTTTEKITLAALTDDLQEGDEDVILEISETSDPLVRIGTGSVVIISDIYPSDSLPATPVSKEIPANPDITPDPLVSPNNDGQGNEFFKIENIVSFPDNEVVIFNRWGNEIFRVRGYNESDRVFSGIANTGLVTNTNSPLPDGVYYYLITTKRIVNGQSIVALNKGYLILKR